MNSSDATLLSELARNVALPLFQIAVIILLTLLVLRVLHVVGQQAQRHAEQSGLPVARQARVMTLLNVSLSTFRILILIIAALMIMYALGINVAPVLTGLGIAGLAVSLGAQTLIRDALGGLMILIENQFDVGDTIQVGATTGAVERITLRATYLRDVDGKLVLVPNGDIRTVSNISRDWGRAIVDLTLAFDKDIIKAVQVLEAAMRKVGEDSAIKPYLLESPEVVGWNTLTAAGVQVRLMAKTQPDRQAQVAATLRRYALEALHSADIQATGV